jgi:hypothetical protein
MYLIVSKKTGVNTPVPEFINPVFVKTSPKRSFLVIENERFGLVFANTGSIKSGTGLFQWDARTFRLNLIHVWKAAKVCPTYLESGDSKES